jgi:hypothetical protein
MEYAMISAAAIIVTTMAFLSELALNRLYIFAAMKPRNRQKPIEGKYRYLSDLSTFIGNIFNTGNKVIKNHSREKEMTLNRLKRIGIQASSTSIVATEKKMRGTMIDVDT